MKNKSKKRIVLALATTMLLSMLAACAPADEAPTDEAPGAETPADNGDTAQSTDFELTYPIEGDVSLTYWVPLPAPLAKIVTNQSETPVMQAAAEQTGVNIEFIHPAVGMEAEDFNLMIASNDLPDIIGAPQRYVGGEFQGMYDGIFLELQDMLPTYAPDYYKYIQEDEIFAREVSDEEGNIPMVCAYKPFGDTDWMYYGFQQSVLDELGMDVPMYIEDYEALFDAMLGAGMTPFMLNKFGYEVPFLGAYGVYATNLTKLYQDLDGNVHYAPLEDGYLDYLTKMNEWYNKGYISKDFAATDGSQADVLFDTFEIGTYRAPCVALYNRNEAQGNEVTIAPQPRIEEGQSLHYSDVYITTSMPHDQSRAALSVDCSNPEAALQYFNFWFTEVGIELGNWGTEGVNFEVVDGQNAYTETMYDDTMDNEGLNYYYKLHFWPKFTGPDVEVHANLLKSPGALEIRTRYGDDENFDSAFILPNIRLTDDELNDRTDIISDADTYVDEMTLKFITGATPLSEYENFVATLEGMDVQTAIDITQTALDRYLGK